MCALFVPKQFFSIGKKLSKYSHMLCEFTHYELQSAEKNCMERVLIYLEHEGAYSSLSLLQYCWDKKKASLYPDYRNIQYKLLPLCNSWDIDLISQ